MNLFLQTKLIHSNLVFSKKKIKKMFNNYFSSNIINKYSIRNNFTI